MTETKFTPGPWVYRRKTREIGTVDKSDTQSYGMLLVVAYIDEFDHEEHEANAHLIAAAPELYEVLEEAVSHFDEWARDASVASVEDAEAYLFWMAPARAALSKARGES